jgi:hypothetical protein
MAEFGQLVRRLSPDVVCIQEAMIRAYCANPKAKADSNDRRIRGQPADDEAAKLKEMLHSPFDSTRPTPPGGCLASQPHRLPAPSMCTHSRCAPLPVPRAGYHTSYSLANERKAGTVMLTKKSLGHIPVHCSISSALAAIQAQAEADSHAAAVTTHSPAAAAAVSNTAPAVANISDSASAVTAPAGATVPSRASARPRWPHRAAMRRTVRRRRHGVS